MKILLNLLLPPLATLLQWKNKYNYKFIIHSRLWVIYMLNTWCNINLFALIKNLGTLIFLIMSLCICSNFPIKIWPKIIWKVNYSQSFGKIHLEISFYKVALFPNFFIAPKLISISLFQVSSHSTSSRYDSLKHSFGSGVNCLGTFGGVLKVHLYIKNSLPISHADCYC